MIVSLSGIFTKIKSFTFTREKPEELGIYHAGDSLEILLLVAELVAVSVNDEEMALVILDPVLILVVQAGEIVNPDGLLILAAALLNLLYKIRDGGLQINEKVRHLHQGHHKVEEVGICLEIPRAHQTHIVEVRSEDSRILVDGPVLNDDIVGLGNLHHVLETLVQEINLEIERPSAHILIEVREIWIEIDRLVFRCPSVPGSEHPRESGLSAADVSGYCYMHDALRFTIHIFHKNSIFPHCEQKATSIFTQNMPISPQISGNAVFCGQFATFVSAISRKRLYLL